MKDKGKILVFQIDENSLHSVKEICRKLDLALIEVPVKDYDQKMLALTGIGKAQKCKTNTTLLPGPMLVFVGLEEQVMDEFLIKYKEVKEKKHSLKAVLTMYNSFWTPKQLYEELSREQRKIRNK